MAHRRGRIWRAVRNSPGMQIAIYFFAFGLLIALYTYIFHLFYPVLENKPLSWASALLFVVESMTTVGYGDLLPFSNDLTMLLAIQIMISGVIMIFIVVPLLLAPFLTTLLAPTPPRKTPHMLRGHTVVFGYDQLTHSVVDSLMISDHDIVIIEQDKGVALDIATRYRRRAYVIWGEYTNPATWDAAHLANADFIVIGKNERLTANIVLGIRGTASGTIISVVDKLAFAGYLRYAGADHVLSPKYTTGKMLARNAILTPETNGTEDNNGTDRMQINLRNAGGDLRLIHVPVVSGCGAASRSLGDLDLFAGYGVTVPFLWKAGRFITDPGPELVIDHTVSLFLFGRADAIARAIREVFTRGECTNALAVIAGFGDVGRGAYEELAGAGISCMIVDARHQGLEQVVGNAEDEDVLKRSRIGEARFCIVALNDDNVNIFTTLMARNLNPAVRILSRANNPSSVEKLYRAGADYVALLPMIGGQTIARIILAGKITILLDLPDGSLVVMKRLQKPGPATAASLTRRSGVRILGIEGIGRSVVAPAPGEALQAGDDVIAVGSTEQLKKFVHQL